MTLIIENVSTDLAKAIKSVAKLTNAKITTKPSAKKQKGSTLKAALQELENGEYETFENFKAYKKAMKNV